MKIVQQTGIKEEKKNKNRKPNADILNEIISTNNTHKFGIYNAINTTLKSQPYARVHIFDYKMMIITDDDDLPS